MKFSYTYNEFDPVQVGFRDTLREVLVELKEGDICNEVTSTWNTSLETSNGDYYKGDWTKECLLNWCSSIMQSPE